MKKFLFIIAIILFSKNVNSQDGLLDATFGTAGVVNHYISTNVSTKYETAVQPDGKIVVVGDGFGDDQDFLVLRFNSDGTPDNSFDGDGAVTINIIDSGLDDANAVAVQQDGKIVVAGFTDYVNAATKIIAVVRLNDDGTLDNTFDEDGIVTTDVIDGEFTNYDETGQAVTLQTDGKIIVAGNKYRDDFNGNSDRSILVIRYNGNGTIDSTFDNDGIVTTDLTAARDEANGVAVQSDGKILVTGRTRNTNYDLVVLRYNYDGSPDYTFSLDGYDIIDFGSGDDVGYGVTVQPDNKILVAGTARNTNNDFAIIRYDENGNLDQGFGTDGITSLDFNNTNDIGYSFSLLQNGKIIVAGRSGSPFALARFNSDGTLDTGFGTSGKTTTDFGDASFFPSDGKGVSAAVQSDGKIVICGGILDMDIFAPGIGLGRYTGSSAPLPVELTSFSAFVNGLSMTLKWETATEVNNYGFEIERRSQGSGDRSQRSEVRDQNENDEWEKVGFVKGYGNSNSEKQYYFVDKNLSEGKYLYRLKQIDNDGQFEFSETVEVSFMKPAKFELAQNYPNPFNPLTKIMFSIDAKHFTTLKIYDLLGKEISVLINEEKEPGTYEVEFDGSALSSGIYYCTLKSGIFSSTKKLLLLK